MGVECLSESVSDFFVAGKGKKLARREKDFWLDDGHDSGPNQISCISYADSAVFRNAPILPRARCEGASELFPKAKHDTDK